MADLPVPLGLLSTPAGAALLFPNKAFFLYSGLKRSPAQRHQALTGWVGGFQTAICAFSLQK